MFSALGPRLWIRMEKLVQILQVKQKKKGYSPLICCFFSDLSTLVGLRIGIKGKSLEKDNNKRLAACA